MPHRPNSIRLNSAAVLDDMLDLDRCSPLPVLTTASLNGEPDDIPKDIWLVIDRDRPVISFRQQVLAAMEAERRRIEPAVAGHG